MLVVEGKKELGARGGQLVARGGGEGGACC